MRMAVGVDMLVLARIKKSIKNPRFLAHVFSDAELVQYRARGARTSHLAGCFCAKEAFSKALGTGVRGFALREISVLRDSRGSPYFEFADRALALVRQAGLHFEVSISNTDEHVIAFVVGYPCEDEKE